MTDAAVPEPIVVVDYDPRWPQQFAELRGVLGGALGELALAVEHVGSTAVPGLAAKPILDVDVVVASAARLPEVVGRLAPLGYRHRGDLDVPGREAFGRDGEDVPRDGSGRRWPAHHLYVCAQGAPALIRHLEFRDYLRRHPAAARAYAELKRGLARRYRDDRERYTEAKTAFTEGVMLRAGAGRRAAAGRTRGLRDGIESGRARTSPVGAGIAAGLGMGGLRPEADLMARARRGDAAAREALARALRRPAYLAALQLLGNREDALDVAQDTLLRLFARLDRIDPKRPVRPWLMTVARNRARDLLRQRGTRRSEPLAVLARVAGPAGPTSDPESESVRQQQRARLWSALAALPEAMREILVLRDYQDLSYAEIAEVLGVPRGTVMSRLHRARCQLRDRFVEGHAEEGGR